MHIGKQDERATRLIKRAGSAQSAGVFGVFDGGMMRVRYRPLQYTLLLLLTLFISAAVLVLSTRSIWIDEAMLLRSVYEIGIADFLHPLPYYDQASPFIPSVVIKIISEIAGTNFVLFRILIFAFTVICAAPLLIRIKRMYGMNAFLAFILISAANVYNVLFHVTEIKHYAFEIAAVFIFLYWLLIYMEDPEQSLTVRRIWLPLLAIAMGFSTLLLVPGFFLFVMVDSMIRLAGRISPREVAKQHGLIFIAMLATALVMYAQMKHLTVFQMGNTWSESAYGSRGLREDVTFFTSIIKETYGRNFLIVFALVSITALFLNKNTVSFRLTVFFISISSIVFILKLIGMYPVVATRHIVWMIPINIAITALVLHDLWSSNKGLFYMLSVFFIFNVGTILVKEGFKLAQGFTAEYHDNNALYTALKNMESSDVFVFGHARPSLEIYQMKIPALSRHRYFGLMPGGDVSSIRVPPNDTFAAGLLQDDAFTDWQFAQLPQTRSFLLLISHAGPIGEDSANDHRIRPLRNTLSKNGCEYEAIFTAHQVQILRVSCAQPSEGG